MSEGKVQQKQQARRARSLSQRKNVSLKRAARRFRRRYRPGSGPERRSAISHFASKEAIIEAIVSEIVNARVGR